MLNLLIYKNALPKLKHGWTKIFLDLTVTKLNLFFLLYSDKTEFILFTYINADDKLMALDLCGTSVFPSNSVRNLGAIFDKFMCMEKIYM